MRFLSSGTLLSTLETSGYYFKAPLKTNNWWNFGFMALIFLVIQIVTGVCLAMMVCGFRVRWGLGLVYSLVYSLGLVYSLCSQQ